MSLITYRDATLAPSHTSLLCSLQKEVGTLKFGPLWADPRNVFDCLRRYAREEGHSFSGRTVAQVAEWHLCNPYDLTGEEIDALVRLLQLGQGETKI